MTGPIKVLIVDDHPVFRIGMVALLGSLDGIEVAGQATSEAEALEAAVELEPDVIMMDLDLGGGSGIEATRAILGKRPQTGVLVITMLGDDDSLFASMRAGARGYLLKDADPSEIEWAIRAVARGNVLFGAEVAQRAVASMNGTSSATAAVFPQLTEREREVLDLVARGFDNATIARRLVLSSKTIRNYLSGILAKLHIADRSSLIVAAREAGLGQKTP
jgi:DNA-binding NarL/FixJ family response regulator